MSSRALRRTGAPSTSRSKSPAFTADAAAASSTSQDRAAMSSTLTLAELALSAVYPAVLALGSLFSQISPSTRAAPYSPTTQSHPAHLAPSYFAQKSNVFNVYFVKVAWVWYTAAFVLFLLGHPLTGPAVQSEGGLALTRRRVQALARYAAATACWAAVTQWFFGPPIIDRGFRLSGGRCEMANAEGAEAVVLQGDKVQKLVTAAACKLAGGVWKGGHDISGHVFILILGSAFLLLEAAPVLLQDSVRSGSEDTAIRQEEDEDEGKKRQLGYSGEGREGLSAPTWFLIGVVGLSLWMLLMTATYFHTWVEKLTGLLVAYTAVAAIYLVPRLGPSIGTILGSPGS